VGFGAVDVVTVVVLEVDVVVVLDSDESAVVATASEVGFSETVKFEKEGVVLGKAGVVVDMVVVIVLVDVVADGVGDIACGVVGAAVSSEVTGFDDDVFMLESILVDAGLTAVTQDDVDADDDADRDENGVVAAADVCSLVATFIVVSFFVVSFFVISSTMGGVDDVADVFGDGVTIIFVVVVVVLFVDVDGCSTVISLVVSVALDCTVLVVLLLVADVGADTVRDE
jgi:hypothetical protein